MFARRCERRCRKKKRIVNIMDDRDAFFGSARGLQKKAG
jgi:hypothetical protein